MTEFVFDTERLFGNQGFTPTRFISGQGLPELINSKLKNPVGIEVGADDGTTSVHILSNVPGSILHCVDPYHFYVDWNGNHMNDRAETFAKFKRDTEQFGDRVILHHKMSDDAVDEFEDNAYDFIFIDGLHTYEQVIKDCRNYWPKIKSGGIFAGHDYSVIPAVNKAVHEFMQEVGQDEVFTTANDVWYWIKP